MLTKNALSKILITGTVILIIAFGSVFFWQYNKTMPSAYDKTMTADKPAVKPAVEQTAQPGLDETLDEFDNMASSEGTAANEEDDSAIVTDDSQAISDFGQSYDENQL